MKLISDFFLSNDICISTYLFYVIHDDFSILFCHVISTYLIIASDLYSLNIGSQMTKH